MQAPGGKILKRLSLMNQIDAIKFLCNCLNMRDNQMIIKRAMKKESFSWSIIISIANHHRLIPSLYHCLNQKGLFESLPDVIQQQLFVNYKINEERNKRIVKQCIEIIENFNSIGIIPLLIKGTSHIMSGLYKDNAMRMMIDIDMLVPVDQFHDAIMMLKQIGYSVLKTSSDNICHHYPAMIRPNEVASVELHHHMVLSAYQHLMPIDEVWYHSVPMKIGSHRYRIPSARHCITLNIIHNVLCDLHFSFADIHLYQLYDFILIHHFYKNENWQIISDLFNKHKFANAFNYYMTFAEKLFFEPALPRIANSRLLSKLGWHCFYYQHKFKHLQFSLKFVFFHLICFMNFIKHPVSRKAMIKKFLQLNNYQSHIDFIYKEKGTRVLNNKKRR